MSASIVCEATGRATPSLTLAWVNPHSPIEAQPWLSFEANLSGYFIVGTKLQLQALGIGVGVPFPGDPGGAVVRGPTGDLRGQLHVADSNGNPVRVWADARWPDAYCAHLPRPGVPERSTIFGAVQERAFQPGVTIAECVGFDCYVGAADALVAADIVPAGHFPGMSGMRKTLVTIHADGSLPNGAPTANNSRAHEPGARSIHQVRKGVYEVHVFCAADERARRTAIEDERLATWEALARSVPMPDPPRRDVRRLFRLVSTGERGAA